MRGCTQRGLKRKKGPKLSEIEGSGVVGWEAMGAGRTQPLRAGRWGGGRRGYECRRGGRPWHHARAPFPSPGGWGLGARSGRGVKEGEEEEQAWMCLREDRREAEEAEGGGKERVAPCTPSPPSLRPRPAPPPRQQRRHRSWDPLPAPGPAAAWKEQESKSKASCTPQVFPTSPPAAAGVQRLGASPRRYRVAERKGTGGGGGRRSARVRGESGNIC